MFSGDGLLSFLYPQNQSNCSLTKVVSETPSPSTPACLLIQRIIIHNDNKDVLSCDVLYRAELRVVRQNSVVLKADVKPVQVKKFQWSTREYKVPILAMEFEKKLWLIDVLNAKKIDQTALHRDSILPISLPAYLNIIGSTYDLSSDDIMNDAPANVIFDLSDVRPHHVIDGTLPLSFQHNILSLRETPTHCLKAKLE